MAIQNYGAKRDIHDSNRPEIVQINAKKYSMNTHGILYSEKCDRELLCTCVEAPSSSKFKYQIPLCKTGS